MKRIVIALGGNALQEAGKPATAESQLEVVEKTSAYIADIIEAGYDVVIAHGNGPQVGRIVLQNETATNVTPAMPFDVCGAMSQGYIGYHIQQGLTKVLRQRGVDKQVVTVVTQVVVDKNDPKFQNPSKPIGPFYTKEEAEKIAAEKGYTMKEDAGRGYRRVVASPLPVEIVELDAVKALENAGFVVVTVGGGGIPVIRNEDGTLTGTAAVIDKDLASEKLAEDLDADALVILTAVENVSINYKKPDQKDLSLLSEIEDADERFFTLPIFRCRNCVIVSEKHPLAGRESVRASELDGQTILRSSRRTAGKNDREMRKLWERCCPHSSFLDYQHPDQADALCQINAYPISSLSFLETNEGFVRLRIEDAPCVSIGAACRKEDEARYRSLMERFRDYIVSSPTYGTLKERGAVL